MDKDNVVPLRSLSPKGSSKPTVTIIASSESQEERAAALLIFTKHTRLEMSSEGHDHIVRRCLEEPGWMEEELAYMAKTIRSSWEFLDITFSIKGISRACAQQLTRTRFTPIDGDIFGSYAMQSQRVTDMSEATWHTPASVENEGGFNAVMQQSISNYQALLDAGVSLEDARGVLPMNLHCNLIAKYNLRMLVDLITARSSYRVQGEFQDLVAAMKAELIELWPWAEIFLQPKAALGSQLLREAQEVCVDMANCKRPVDLHKLNTLMAKSLDQMEGDK